MKWICCTLLYLLIHLQEPSAVLSRRGRRGRDKKSHTFLPSTSIRHMQSDSHANKRAACVIALPDKCSCSKHDGALSITCYDANLTVVPKLEVASNTVRTLNLEQNRLTSIKIGSFFGMKIERLLLSNNSISTLDFLAFWGLEYHLETLDLSYNAFTNVPSSPLRLLRNLRSLSLKGNQITALRDFDFGYLRALDVLSLDKNPVASIAPHTFDGTSLSLLILNDIDLSDHLVSFPAGDLKHLKGLSLANNGLTKLPGGWASNLKSLQYLCLDNNMLSSLPPDAFAGLDALETLELNSNRFHKVPREAIQDLTNLKTLEMRHNRLRKLYPKTFNASENLQTLDLSHNRIRKLSIHAFDGLDEVQKVDLRHNSIITLDDRTLYWNNPAGRQIFLADNPWLCNCLLTWIKREHKRKTELSQIFADASEMHCARPDFLADFAIIRVHLRDFTCDHQYYYYYEIVDEEGDPEEEDMDEEYDNKDYNYDEHYDYDYDYGDTDEYGDDSKYKKV